MNPEGKNTASLILVVVLGVSLIFSIAKNVSLTLKLKQVQASTQQALVEKDKKMEADRNLYTGLAARLHNEIKKSAKLEEELKRYKK